MRVQDPTWTPKYLNKTLGFGLDPRKAIDGLSILEVLTSAGITLSRTRISRATIDALQELEFTDEAEVLGPRFTCPACRQTLLHAPIRSFLVDELLSMLPAEINSDSSDEGTSGVNGQARGKERVYDADWTKFFGNGLGHEAEGYKVLEQDDD